jgi:chromosome segregation ATPase
MEKYLKDIIEKQNENIEQIRDVMLWRTNKFKTMVVEWEMANEKVKAMDNHLTNYILDSDKAHGRSIERRDTKIEDQAKRIKELETLEYDNIELKNANKLAHECIKELEEQYAIETDGQEHIGLYVNNLQEEHAKLKDRIKELEGLEIFHTNKIFDISTTPEMVSKDVAITYQKELVKAEKRIKELEKRVGRIDELTNEVYEEAPDYPTKFTLNNVVYFEDSRGCFMIANDGATDFTVTITHQEYIDSLNQYLKQEDPRDYPEEHSE